MEGESPFWRFRNPVGSGVRPDRSPEPTGRLQVAWFREREGLYKGAACSGLPVRVHGRRGFGGGRFRHGLPTDHEHCGYHERGQSCGGGCEGILEFDPAQHHCDDRMEEGRNSVFSSSTTLLLRAVDPPKQLLARQDRTIPPVFGHPEMRRGMGAVAAVDAVPCASSATAASGRSHSRMRRSLA